MGFEVVPRGEWLPGSRLPDGECSIGASGHLTFRKEDLALVQIVDAAVVVVDVMTLRLAIRKPRDHEARTAMMVGVVADHKKCDSGRRIISATRAIKRLSLTARAVRGRYPLTTKDDLLIINLADAELGSVEKGGTNVRRE